ncbi:2-amino-4-hydroxy-6-hydroxymethyldihydropteridine pyrophosphokinase [Bacillus sp. FJAT-27916]|uniref:2-amino-4-hydroxy-6- hydroxymethyldihydropteridine diphosphokinase n=1 Tax=Bacillus sp. FJAT-27916 TaxID=1679169 RepID=UPI00067177D7|nr:2-amino-4-hydroxy-6-hydroxymethyldihydropteridine diphosphokinase [Bacillus sp. FJAT-27916]KMY46137.1 2-amino-4-hydroxy-6-hydroxymethyldihydropteridine pyrophosphokinase [Bacillus sp. FJAT-27916]
MNSAYIGLGTNLGDRESYLMNAIEELSSHPSNRITAVSSIYETNPWGYEEQGKFLNMVICLQTELSPQDLLACCMYVEKKLGRKREIRWGPRTIDLDILLYNQENIVTENLIIPHPRIMERAFVAIPLVELDKDITLPNMDKPVREVMDDIPDKKGVRVWKQKDGEGAFGLSGN